MLGVKIQHENVTNNGGFLSFDLREILSVIGEPIKKSQWRCYDLYYTAIRDGRFTEIREERLKFSGEELIELASEIHQTNDGRFEAKAGGATKKPWLVIVAVDSSWFEVWSSKPWVIEKLRAHFQLVSDLPTRLSQPLTQ